MADARGLRRLVTEYGRTIHGKAATATVNAVSAATPRTSGRLERARRRRDAQFGTVFSAAVEQPGGQGEPDALPNWLDGNVQFVITPKRARFLVFPKVPGLGAASFPRGFVFARRVLWRPRPSSVGFWSRNVNAEEWRRSLEAAQSSTSVGPS